MSLSTQTYDNVPLGMNLTDMPHEINDRQARYIQDAVVATSGIVQRRGPVTGIAMTSIPAGRAISAVVGMVQTQDPKGSQRIMVIAGGGGSSPNTDSLVFDDTETYIGSVPDDKGVSVSVPHNSAPRIGGGVWFTRGGSYETSSTFNQLALWRGMYADTYATGTLTTTRGSTAVVGVGTTFAQTMVGGFLFDTNGRYLGTVQTVTDATNIILEKPSWHTTAAVAYTIRPVRGFVHRYSKGTVTVASGGVTATGFGTKFLSWGIDNTYGLYRASDLTFIGTVNATATSDTSLTITAAAIGADNEPYFLMRTSTGTPACSRRRLVTSSYAGALDTSTTESVLAYTVGTRTLGNTVGFITAAYAHRQWYANLPVNRQPQHDLQARIWFSSLTHPEAVDTAVKEGDYFTLPHSGSASKGIRALVPTRAGLLVFTLDEVWIITGDDPDNFSLSKLSSDGVGHGAGAIEWGGGCFWAGRQGIYYFDGSYVQNITKDTLGDWYTQLIGSSASPLDYNSDRIYLSVFRDHLLANITKTTSSYSLVKGSTATSPPNLTLVFNLVQKGWTAFTNVGFRGSVVIPKNNTPWYAIIDNGGLVEVCNGAKLFDTEGNDVYICTGNTAAGPDFYLETKRYAVGDPLRKKLWKSLIFHYTALGDSLTLDFSTGLNEPGVTSSTVLPASTTTWAVVASSYNSWSAASAAFTNWLAFSNISWTKKKIRFLKRDQLLGFRLYQTTASVTGVRIGPWQFGFKYLRAGRV